MSGQVDEATCPQMHNWNCHRPLWTSVSSSRSWRFWARELLTFHEPLWTYGSIFQRVLMDVMCKKKIACSNLGNAGLDMFQNSSTIISTIFYLLEEVIKSSPYVRGGRLVSVFWRGEYQREVWTYFEATTLSIYFPMSGLGNLEVGEILLGGRGTHFFKNFSISVFFLECMKKFKQFN